ADQPGITQRLIVVVDERAVVVVEGELRGRPLLVANVAEQVPAAEGSGGGGRKCDDRGLRHVRRERRLRVGDDQSEGPEKSPFAEAAHYRIPFLDTRGNEMLRGGPGKEMSTIILKAGLTTSVYSPGA